MIDKKDLLALSLVVPTQWSTATTTAWSSLPLLPEPPAFPEPPEPEPPEPPPTGNVGNEGFTAIFSQKYEISLAYVNLVSILLNELAK
ncbi:hypothetical protein [Pedobacter sp. GR22-10]|uniref:hypothetical protein n=1 Tax=Pedobacter sp. GR22-10 TaxID=2994472 RepID=UPI0022457BC5|nr:hypothetical protein [Pedobacter sp. GR22-10]MCX2432836.1 hypothetical protein [Pedobacter sp. GR22-10]